MQFIHRSLFALQQTNRDEQLWKFCSEVKKEQPLWKYQAAELQLPVASGEGLSPCDWFRLHPFCHRAAGWSYGAITCPPGQTESYLTESHCSKCDNAILGDKLTLRAFWHLKRFRTVLLFWRQPLNITPRHYCAPFWHVKYNPSCN